MQQFLERETGVTDLILRYINPMQRFLERKTVASNRFNSEVASNGFQFRSIYNLVAEWIGSMI
jgi:hypothetical protein